VSCMARVLRDMVIKENRGFLTSLIDGKQEAVRAFRDEAVEHLAPLLVEGLTRAASDQQVGFRVVQTGAPAESTKGSLYAYGRSLYLTLPWLLVESQVRARRARAITHDPLYPRVGNTAGQLSRHSLNCVTLVIDYNLLPTMPAASDLRPTAAQPPTSAKGEPTQRDTDLDALRKELEDIKKKLAEQEAERTRFAPSSSPKPTP
jgi:hypothetical protein